MPGITQNYRLDMHTQKSHYINTTMVGDMVYFTELFQGKVLLGICAWSQWFVVKQCKYTKLKVSKSSSTCFCVSCVCLSSWFTQHISKPSKSFSFALFRCQQLILQMAGTSRPAVSFSFLPFPSPCSWLENNSTTPAEPKL